MHLKRQKDIIQVKTQSVLRKVNFYYIEIKNIEFLILKIQCQRWKYMNRKELWKELHDKSNVLNYQNGKFKSNIYSKEELAEKRKYFENKRPLEKFKISETRWLGEVKRCFEKTHFKEYPDATFARLEFVLNFGL